MCKAPIPPARMLDAQSLGAAVALGSIEDRLDCAGLPCPNRIPSLGSLLEAPVCEELLARGASTIGRIAPRRPNRPNNSAPSVHE